MDHRVAHVATLVLHHIFSGNDDGAGTCSVGLHPHHQVVVGGTYILDGEAYRLQFRHRPGFVRGRLGRTASDQRVDGRGRNHGRGLVIHQNHLTHRVAHVAAEVGDGVAAYHHNRAAARRVGNRTHDETAGKGARIGDVDAECRQSGLISGQRRTRLNNVGRATIQPNRVDCSRQHRRHRVGHMETVGVVRIACVAIHNVH